MGASSSTEQAISSEQREVESLVASTGAKTLLLNSFAQLSDPDTHAIPIQSLQPCFCLSYKNLVYEAPCTSDSFPELLHHLGSSIVDLFFISREGGVEWIEFMRGYLSCCGRMPAQMSLNVLLRVFASTAEKAGIFLKLEFESNDDGCKISGFLRPLDVALFLWMCWSMLWNSRALEASKENGDLCVPDVTHLVLSAVVSCTEVGHGELWDCDVLHLEIQLPVGKFLTWAFSTVPCIADCFTEFVNARLQNVVTAEDRVESSNSALGGSSSSSVYNTGLLTRGRAWAISLTLRGAQREEILKPCFPSDLDAVEENLLYRSSVHGKGLNRFWSNIEGYVGPLLILVSATSGDTNGNSTSARKWIIGALSQQAFENKDVFYGTSGTLYAICPVFDVFPPSGKEKNFVYCHLHPSTKAYDPHPKPEGIAFGGNYGNERIFIDEDFARVTVRHHAIDKTYQHGSLLLDQGYLPVEGLMSEVEVWGLGGSKAKHIQASFKKREDLFTTQRRTVDLKSFSNWEDSPEKMMMDMMGDPNKVRREDR